MGFLEGLIGESFARREAQRLQDLQNEAIKRAQKEIEATRDKDQECRNYFFETIYPGLCYDFEKVEPDGDVTVFNFTGEEWVRRGGLTAPWIHLDPEGYKHLIRVAFGWNRKGTTSKYFAIECNCDGKLFFENRIDPCGTINDGNHGISYPSWKNNPRTQEWRFEQCYRNPIILDSWSPQGGW